MIRAVVTRPPITLTIRVLKDRHDDQQMSYDEAENKVNIAERRSGNRSLGPERGGGGTEVVRGVAGLGLRQWEGKLL